VHRLVCHPRSLPGAVRSLSAQVGPASAGLLVTFVLQADPNGVRIPPPRPAAMASGLWRHTCCEIFVARKGSDAYHEFNLSPSGEWAAHRFARYREGAMLADASLDPHIAVRRDGEILELQATIRMPPQPARLGLAAVIEAAEGTLSYWALRHPPGAPDFHHRDAFALEL